MRTKMLFIVGLGFLIGSCGDDGGGGGPVSPATGVWGYSEYAAGTNTCNLNDIAVNSNGDFKIVTSSASSFTVDPQDGTPQFTCTLSGSSFNCPKRGAADYTHSGSTLSGKISATGTFSGDKSVSGTQNGDVTCTGSACSAAEALLKMKFPCAFSVSFKATWKSN